MTAMPDAATTPARALDPHFNRDPDVYAREITRIFFPTWQ